MSIPPEPRDVPTCATDTIGELPPAAMDGGTNYQNEVAILRAQLAEQQAQHQAELSRVAMASADVELAHESDVRELERRLAEAAELALRLSCEKGALGKSLAEAQELLGADTGYDCTVCGQRIYGVMVGMGDGTGNKFGHRDCYYQRLAKDTEQEAREYLSRARTAERDAADLTTRLERAEGALRMAHERLMRHDLLYAFPEGSDCIARQKIEAALDGEQNNTPKE